MTSQNGQTHFKNLLAFAAVSDHFRMLYIKGLKSGHKELNFRNMHFWMLRRFI